MKGNYLFALSLFSCITLTSYAQEIKGKLQNWNFFLRNVHFGPVYEIYGGQEYSPKIITDLAVSYTITKGIQLTVGSNNLFDIYPDKVKDKALQEDGRYIYSPAVYQFGINGRFVFAKLNFTS